MTDDPDPPGMIGPSPSERGLAAVPADPAEHALQFSREWRDRLDQYCATRMEELGIPPEKNGEEDPDHPGTWRSFVPHERTGGFTGRGLTVNSGVLNPELLKGQKGVRVFAKASLRDRIDATIAHEYEEDRLGTHEKALKAAPKTELPITDGARRILRAMAR